MKKAILSSLIALAFLAGCQTGKKPAPAKWEGPPYRLTISAQPVQASSAGITLPPIYYKANPEAIQTRANLVMRVDTSGVKRPGKITDQLLLMPTDISGTQGSLSNTYLTTASGELTKMLTAYCMKGKIKVNIALVKSSIMMSATNAQVDSRRLSDWQVIEVDFKNPNPRC